MLRLPAQVSEAARECFPDGYRCWPGRQMLMSIDDRTNLLILSRFAQV